MAHDYIIELFERHARKFDRDRGRSLQERTWIDRFLQHVPPSGRILDVGCGMGEPIARYLIDAGRLLVGIDSSPSLIAMCRSRFPAHEWVVADMRALALGSRFDGIVAGTASCLHPDDQSAMIPRLVRPADSARGDRGSRESGAVHRTIVREETAGKAS